METEGPFMKRDVKRSVTGPTSVSMSVSLTSRHSLPYGTVHSVQRASRKVK